MSVMHCVVDDDLRVRLNLSGDLVLVDLAGAGHQLYLGREHARQLADEIHRVLAETETPGAER
ncbi:hypothetical protein [Nocardia sp. BMG51109]|uniref:hypothetical protein n=1 Tax=Nocardia sp. BMG51109 TaxID=1056816 RepID=UPI0012EBEA89|nr:hypothetical protein [Nocardia sp. BMG51109]